MPEVNNAGDGTEVVDNNGEVEIKTDAFGVEDTKPPVETKKEEVNKYEAIPVDHPTIKSLQDQITQLSTDKGSMGTNLSKQGEIIKDLSKTIENLKSGKTETPEGDNVLFKDIKFSKDLSDEERDDMTDTEIKQMDTIAEMQTTHNRLYSESVAKEKESQTKQVEDVNSTIKELATEITMGEDEKPNVEMANKVIESFKSLGFNIDGKTKDELKKLVEISAKEIPDYKPAKENKKVTTKTVKAGATPDDPFGNNAIVEEATKAKDGNYSL